MRKISAILFLMAITLGCQQQKEQPQTTILSLGTPYIYVNEFMKGKVKEVKETLYWAKDENGQIQKGEPISWKDLDSLVFSHSFTAYFDENGQIFKCESFDENGKVVDYWNSQLENGKIIKASAFSKDSNTLNFTYKYDENGDLVEASVFNPITDTLYNRWAFFNNKDHLYDKIEFYNYKNDLRGKNVLLRSENGRVLKREYYNKNDSVTVVEMLTYNDKDLVDSQEIFVRGNSNGKWSYTYSYEGKGNWETIVCYKEGKPMIFAERSYVYY
ncbi:MAG: hypothetical protein AB7S48_08065 [Bacteroidales bacterium]